MELILQKNTNRIQSADLLKGLAVIFMIQVHIIELLAKPNALSDTSYSLFLFFGGPFVAPVYIVCMGYFVGATLKRRKQLYARGVKVFVLGIVLNIALNTNLIISVGKGKYSIDIFPYLFGVDILLFAGIAILLLARFKDLIFKHKIVTLILAMLCSFLGDYLPRYSPDHFILKYILSLFFGSCHWSYFPLFPWLSYALVGVFLHSIKTELKGWYDKIPKWAGFVLLPVYLIFTMSYGLKVTLQLQDYYHHGLIFFSWTIMFLIVYSLFVFEVNQFAGQTKPIKYLKWLGMNVTSIYVIQWVLIGNIATEIYRTLNSAQQIIIYFLGILILTSLFCYLIKMLTTKINEN